MQERNRTKTGVVQELLLILAGHRSQLQACSSPWHPATVRSLAQLIEVSNLYIQLSRFAQRVTRIQSSHDLLAKDTESPSISAFGASLLLELSVYQDALVDLEFRLLSHDPSLVPADANQAPSPPLAAILAELVEWHSIFQALVNLVNHLENQINPPIQSISSPDLIQVIYHHSLTGSPRLAQILSRLQASVEQVWIDGFRSFVLYGHAPLESSASNHSHLPLDDLFYAHRPILTAGLSQSYQPIRFSFAEKGLPNLPVLDPIDQLRDSIQEICLALSILNHLIQPNHAKPSSNLSNHPRFNKIPFSIDLQHQLRKSLSPINRLSHPGFRIAIKNIQETLSNYLFSTHLTPDILSTTLQTLMDVFLLRHSTFARNLVEGFIRVKSNRLGSGGGAGTDSVHRSLRVRKLMSLSERELDVILIKAGISTELGEEPTARKINLEGFSFRLLRFKDDQEEQEEGIQVNKQEDIKNQKGQRNQATKLLIDQTFSKLILNSSHPTLLTYSPQPGLSLFLTDDVCSSYSKINSCLFSFLITKHRFKDCWRELNQRERLRIRWLRQENEEDSVKFTRLAFEGLRRMSWFIDLMVAYFFHDVIDQSVDLLSKEINHQHHSSNYHETQQHESNKDEHDMDNKNQSTPAKKGNSSNFFKSHRMFLALVEIGLGFKNSKCETVMKSLLSCCFDFLIKVENWSFDLIPNLLSSLDLNPERDDDEEENIGMKIKERGRQLIESIQTFNQLLKEYIVELRKDDFNSTTNTSSLNAETNSHFTYLDKTNNDVVFSSDEDSSSFFLKASIFRRKSLDSLLLNFDFNHWFSCAPSPI